MGKGFDQYAGEYDAWFIANPNVLASEAKLVAATLRDGGRILSVGCGSGLFEKILRDDYGIDIQYGIEPSEAMAAIARKRGLDVDIATAENYDYPPATSTPSCLTDVRATSPTSTRCSIKYGRPLSPAAAWCLSTCPRRAPTASCTTSPRP